MRERLRLLAGRRPIYFEGCAARALKISDSHRMESSRQVDRAGACREPVRAAVINNEPAIEPKLGAVVRKRRKSIRAGWDKNRARPEHAVIRGEGRIFQLHPGETDGLFSGGQIRRAGPAGVQIIRAGQAAWQGIDERERAGQSTRRAFPK